MEGKDGRTERATSKRRKEAREKGNLCFSNEIVTVLSLFIGFIAFRIAVPHIGDSLIKLWNEIMQLPVGANESWGGVHMQEWFIRGMGFCAAIILPLALPVMVAGVVASIMQTGFYFSLGPLEWKFAFINPINGLKQLFSPTTLFNVGTAILKVLLISAVCYILLKERFLILPTMLTSEPELSFGWLFRFVFRLAITVVVLFILIAVLDYVFRWYRHEKSLMMTKKEVEDERKNQELPAVVRGAQRRKMQELTLTRMMAAVPRSTVVITNPTHVAVAIEYHPETMNAPRVIAKGLRLVAERIKAIAHENNIPIIEKPEVARELYKTVKVGREVPGKLFGAVAEILAYLYKLGNKRVRDAVDGKTEPPPYAKRFRKRK
jgi:flagellar biosynthetic protein FlhB